MTVQLRHLDIQELIGAAGGDPWQLKNTIQRGSPGEINDVATAFFQAGVCMGDTSDEFNQAKKRFEAAWDRDDSGGHHPINDSAEVQRATESLNLDRERIARIAVDLENISASLAEAQRSAHISIGNFETMLQLIDDQIDREVAVAAANGEDIDWSELKQAAIDRTKHALQEVQSIRDAYSDALDTSRIEMAAEGYSPDATRGADGEGALTPDEQAHAAADKYGAGRRAADEALVNSPGPWSPHRQAAAGRLRDYATINDSNADPAAARYAGERLNDFYMSQFVGPLPVDPVLGGDARSRARNRLDLQQKLEQGFYGMPPLGADAATEMLDRADALGRQLVLECVQDQLKDLGLSDAGVAQVIKNLGSGADLLGGGMEQYGESVPTGKHALDGLSKADAALLEKWGGRIAKIGSIAQLAVAGVEWWGGGENRNEELGAAAGSVGGGFLGGAACGAAVGSVAGPFTAAGAAILGGIIGAVAGEEIGGGIGGIFDPPLTTGAGGKSW
jgi:hypothetical protein